MSSKQFFQSVGEVRHFRPKRTGHQYAGAAFSNVKKTLFRVKENDDRQKYNVGLG